MSTLLATATVLFVLEAFRDSTKCRSPVFLGVFKAEYPVTFYDSVPQLLIVLFLTMFTI